MIKRDPETLPAERTEHVPSRNTGSGPQSPAPNRDQDRDNDRGGYRSTSSFSNSWQDRDERGGRERERERDDRAWRGNSERGRESIGRGGVQKRSSGNPNTRDDRGAENRRECKYFYTNTLSLRTRHPPKKRSFCYFPILPFDLASIFPFPPGLPRRSGRIPQRRLRASATLRTHPAPFPYRMPHVLLPPRIHPPLRCFL